MDEGNSVGRNRDLFKNPPLVPSDWRLLRDVVQAILVIAVLVGPGYPLSPPLTRSTVGVYGVPFALIAVGEYFRRNVSRVLGALLIVGMVFHLVAWISVYIYARWLFRDLDDEFSIAGLLSLADLLG